MKTYQCIGVRNGKQCEHALELPEGQFPYPLHPEWPFLCAPCANEPPRGGSRNTKGIVEEKPNFVLDKRS